jgi:lipopolysaccharide export system permease protein|tara:strand:+ start:24 stop:1097 length:1074 start_codon:yes stop_codon:yes gene_type:complete
MIIFLYLLKRFLYGLLISIIVLTSLDVFFSFTAELKYLNEGTYDFLAISKYIALNLPKSITIMFPYAMLIGAMLSLGAMASDHEFVAMQSAGISVSKIISLILIQSFFISSFFYTISDQLIPEFSSMAETNKNMALNKKIIFQRNGVWFKDKQSYIKIDEIYSQNHLKNITKYDYDENHNLIVIHNIKEATSDGSEWLLKGVESIYINKIPVTKEMHDKKFLDNFIDKNLIMIKTDKSESLSLSDVIKNISYLEQNNLDSDIQKKIFWEKLFQPFSAVIMLFLALPFIFGKLRSTQTSKRIIIGLFIGIAFFIVSSILPNLGMILGLTPFINILIPHLIFVYAGNYLLSQQLESGLR